MSNFTVLPPAYIVGRDIDEIEFFSHLHTLPLGWEGRIAFDTETTGIDVARDVPLFGSVSDGENRWLLTLQQLLHPSFAELVSDPNRVWVMANAKFDMHMCHNVGLPEFAGSIADIIVMCALRDENRKGGAGLGLKEQARDYLGIAMRSFKDTFDIKVKASEEGRALLDADIDLVAGYASLDAYATWLLSEEHEHVLNSMPVPNNLLGFTCVGQYFWELEAPFTKTLWRMERRGVCIDVPYLESLKGPMEQRKDDLLKDIMRLAQRPINPNSPAQLKDVLFSSRDQGGLGLRPKKYTKSGSPSTDEDTLKSFSSSVPLCAAILEYRKLTKILSTYVAGLQKAAVRKTNRIHTRFNQAGTVTGRLSSSDPNLQNIPARGDVGKMLRKAFTAGPGKDMVVADYSQMEMCVMAHVSGDKAMIDAITDGLDLHSFTASRMLGVEYEHVLIAKWMKDLPEEYCELEQGLEYWPEYDIETLMDISRRCSDLVGARTAAKAIGFGLMYGRGPGALAEELGVTRREAKELIQQWFDTFPSVREYIDWVQNEARTREDHAVFTCFGRPRRLTSITSTNHGVRAKAERDAINAPIQGSASCITKRAMILIDQDPELGGDCLEGGSLGTGLLLQVHDEIMLEVPKHDEEIKEWANGKMQKLMVEAAQLRVPLKATGGVASNWEEAK